MPQKFDVSAAFFNIVLLNFGVMWILHSVEK